MSDLGNRIIEHLENGPANVSEISVAVGVSNVQVSLALERELSHAVVGENGSYRLVNGSSAPSVVEDPEEPEVEPEEEPEEEVTDGPEEDVSVSSEPDVLPRDEPDAPVPISSDAEDPTNGSVDRIDLPHSQNIQAETDPPDAEPEVLVSVSPGDEEIDEEEIDDEARQDIERKEILRNVFQDEPGEVSPEDQLCSVLNYLVVQHERQKTIVMDYSDHSFYLTEGDLRRLQAAVEETDSIDAKFWSFEKVGGVYSFLFERVLKTDPPEADDQELSAWLKTFSSPTREPELRSVIKEQKEDEQIDLFIEDFPHLPAKLADYKARIWSKWAKEERIRLKVIGNYNKIAMIERQINDVGDSNVENELFVGVGVCYWRLPDGKSLRYPLITQKLQATRDEEDFSIELIPSDEPPKLSTDMFLGAGESVISLFGELESGLANIDGLNPFVDETFRDLFMKAASQLDAQGSYWPDRDESELDETVPNLMNSPPTTEQLCVTKEWVIFSAPKNTDFIINDLKALQDYVGERGLKDSARELFSRPSDTVPQHASSDWRGISTSGRDRSSNAKDLFFLKPYNEAQERIISRLEKGKGCVVQGPPGTGKTHTIANVISHYLAEGKRILVTSQQKEPLRVLKAQLPESLQPFAVSLLSGDLASKQELEDSVKAITELVQGSEIEEITAEIERLEKKIAEHYSKLAEIGSVSRELLAEHSSEISYLGQRLSTWEVATECEKARKDYEWFVDCPNKPFDETELTPQKISSLASARSAVGNHIDLLGESLGSIDQIPTLDLLLALHKDLVDASDVQRKIEKGDVLALQQEIENPYSQLVEAETALQALEKILEDKDWLSKIFVSDSPVNKARAKSLAKWAERTQLLCTDISEDLEKNIQVPLGALADEELLSAIKRKADGNRPFLLPFGSARARGSLDRITLRGRNPAGIEEWREIRGFIERLQGVQELTNSWNYEQGRAGEKLHEFLWPDSIDFLIEKSEEVLTLNNFGISQLPNLEINLRAIFVAFDELGDWIFDASIREKILESIRMHKKLNSLEEVDRLRGDLTESLSVIAEKISRPMLEIVNSRLGNKDIEANQLEEEWQHLYETFVHASTLQKDFDVILETTALIDNLGAPNWAESLKTVPIGTDSEPLPSDYQDAWNWGYALEKLRCLPSADQIKGLSQDFSKRQVQLERDMTELVRNKVNKGLKERLTSEVLSSLHDYAAAMRQVSTTGRGLRDFRHLRDARAAMELAQKAIPVWVMDHAKVSQALSAEISSFDLVIIDEASQSDIKAIPAMVRGKKLLIVGDDKQVSPSTFVQEAKYLADLRRYLKDVRQRQHLAPGASVYSLASSVFAGDLIRLQDHFRCVEPIISFSNRLFYNSEMRICRVAKPSERLVPTLIDVHVRGGFEKSKRNELEALEIVREISRISQDPIMKSRSIGVVSMKTGPQVDLIRSKLIDQLGIEIFERHQIFCGNAMEFQGREADIMFLSLVDAPGKNGRVSLLPSTTTFEQRYNVACSRARDRMYVFRSFNRKDLKKDDLRGKLLDHMRNSAGSSAKEPQALRALCESGFEEQVFDELVGRGYRVIPQVPAATKRIDMVVEGANDKRLAVECDGDFYHQDWEADMERQRLLEGLGWEFWRVLGSDWARDRKEIIDDLIGILNEKGIEPLGYDNHSTNQEIFEERVISSLDDEQPEPEELALPSTDQVEPESDGNTPVVEILETGENGSDHSETEDLLQTTSEVNEEETFFRVEIGDFITYLDLEANREVEIRIVRTESRPNEGLLNQGTPVARSILGSREGDQISVPLPTGEQRIQLLRIVKES